MRRSVRECVRVCECECVRLLVVVCVSFAPARLRFWSFFSPLIVAQQITALLCCCCSCWVCVVGCCVPVMMCPILVVSS